MNKEQYIETNNLLLKYSKHYYLKNESLISDLEYDKLNRELLEYESNNPNEILKNSISKRVGVEVGKIFRKGFHSSKMWSMLDIFDKDEMKEWFDKRREVKSFLLEPKYDGVSLNVKYDKGMMIEAITRGDGSVGEIVTENALMVKDLPAEIEHKGFIEIRGEVVIKDSDFIILNEELSKNGDKLLSNPRNAASGGLRQLDPKKTKERRLSFRVWDIGKSDIVFNTQWEKLEYLYSMGFEKHKLVGVETSLDGILSMFNKFELERCDFGVGLDGMVVKVNEVSSQIEMGYTNKIPKWMCAYKFKAVERVTILKGIELSVGRFGTITPVALIEPVNIDGVTVSRVTLHNFMEIDRLGLKIGDSIIVIRSGDVIPKILRVHMSAVRGEVKIERPESCPVCGGGIVNENGILRCGNENCISKVIGTIYHFTKRECVDIRGCGKSIIEVLVSNGVIKNVADLYKLDENSFNGLTGFKSRKIHNILTSINNSKGVELYKFIKGLGINNVGGSVGKKLVEKFGKGVFDIKEEDLLGMSDIGEKTIYYYMDYINNNMDYIQELCRLVEPIIKEEVKESGEVVVLTGAMSGGRDKVKSLLESKGIRVSKSVNKNVTTLVYGDKPGSKFDKAKKMNIPTIYIDEYMKNMKGI